MEIRFDNKVAVLTGASRGLGRKIAMTLAEGGADVVIADVLDEAGAATCQEIRSALNMRQGLNSTLNILV